MSDYEQILFYYNALSNMGHPWINRKVTHEDNKGNTVEETMPYSLIIKYRMIKNIPHFFEYFYEDPRKLFKEEIHNWEEEADEPFFEQLEQMKQFMATKNYALMKDFDSQFSIDMDLNLE